MNTYTYLVTMLLLLQGGRDGYSNKDPELDGLASGAKITLGANLDALQVHAHTHTHTHTHVA